jgi:hypothetical protein
LRGVRALVSEENNTTTEFARFNELQIDLIAQLSKYRLAAAKNYRVQVQAIFIDQAKLHEECIFMGRW